MAPNLEFYNFRFKLAYTEQTQNYIISSNISIRNFIETIKNNAKRDFNLRNNEDIEIVEAGNPDIINGIDAEMAPALGPTNATVKQIFGNRHNNTSFYIRLI
jgi:hypothetical protein